MKRTPLEHFAVAVSSLFGAGFFPGSPGTAGSIVTIPLIWFVLAPLPWHFRVGIFAGVLLLGVWTGGLAERVWQKPDSPHIVIDEMAGYILTMIPFAITPGTVIAGLILFRIFDISKPYPCNWVDRKIHGGWGVMLDDIVAGAYSMAALWVLDTGMRAAGVQFYGLGI